MKKKIGISMAAVIALLVGWHYVMSCGSYTYTQSSLPKGFDEFYAQKLAKSKELNVRPKNEEKLVKYADKTPVAILYVHGYGASRAEGEYVVDKISKELKANTYYLRLPGHGINVEEHAKATARDHLDETITTLRMMRLLGDKVVVIGTSMGGVVATYIAAEHPELVDALILSSPAYQFGSTVAKIAGFYPAYKLVTCVMTRRPTSPIPPEKDNWSLYWYTNQYTKSLSQIYQLQSLVSRNSVYRKVAQPVMLLYYFKDKDHQDATASVSDMIDAYGAFNNGIPNPRSRKVQIEKGEHVLLSKYVETTPDYEEVTKEIVSFISSLGWNK